MSNRTQQYAFLALAALLAACARTPARPTTPVTPPRTTTVTPPARTNLPPIPTVNGPLAIDVVYPREGSNIAVRDSTFLFGNVGTGGATLRINGAPVPVEPNGAFLAFLPVPPDGVYRVEAS